MRYKAPKFNYKSALGINLNFENGIKGDLNQPSENDVFKGSRVKVKLTSLHKLCFPLPT